MTSTKYKLTNIEVEDILHNMSPAELWQLNANVEPVNRLNGEIDSKKAEKIYNIMALTALEYENIERILDNPYNAPLCDIHIYCKALNLDIIEFIKKTLA